MTRPEAYELNKIAVQGLTPWCIFGCFAEISTIPRGSGNEKEIADYIVKLATKFELVTKRDNMNNVVIKVPASPGFENRRSVCLQGHLDMVCEKNAEKKHDFMEDPITFIRDGNFLKADGTTLGADNGIGVATMLSIILRQGKGKHGPLELLFTTDEETGLNGAKSVSADFIESKILLNLDSEEFGEFFIGCCGGLRTEGKLKIKYEEQMNISEFFTIEVKGLLGGHSGLEIDKERGNALKVLGEFLDKISGEFRIVSISGGDKMNAIPREASVKLCTLTALSIHDMNFIAEKVQENAKADFPEETSIKINVERSGIGESAFKAFDKSTGMRILLAINLMPHGVIKMSSVTPGFVETSTNLASIKTEGDTVIIQTSQRSNVDSGITEIAEKVKFVFESCGFSFEQLGGYPAWEPKEGSPLLETSKRVYKEMFNEDPKVKNIHAGLETAILSKKFPETDMISFGPTMEGVHSPDERLHIDTVEKFWNLLLRILKNID